MRGLLIIVVIIAVVFSLGGIAGMQDVSAEEPVSDALVVGFDDWTQIGETKVNAILVKTEDGHTCVVAMGGYAMSISCY